MSLLVRIAAIVVSLLVIWNGVAILFVEDYLIKFCRKSCLIDSLLLVFLGSTLGKVAAGLTVIALGSWFFWCGVKSRSDEKDYYRSSDEN